MLFVKSITYLFVLLTYQHIAWSQLNHYHFVPNKENRLEIVVQAKTHYLLHMTGLKPGGILCELTANQEADIKGEVVFFDTMSGELFKDKFKIGGGNGRRVEFILDRIPFGKINHQIESYMLFENNGSINSKAHVNCTLNPFSSVTMDTTVYLPDNNQSSSEHHGDPQARLVSYQAEFKLKRLLENAQKQLPLLREQAKHNMEAVNSALSRLAFEYYELAELCPNSEHYREVFKSIAVELKTMMATSAVTEPKSKIQVSTEKVYQQFKSIVPAVINFLDDICIELDDLLGSDLSSDEKALGDLVKERIRALKGDIISMVLQLEVGELSDIEDFLGKLLSHRLSINFDRIKESKSPKKAHVSDDFLRLNTLQESLSQHDNEIRDMLILALLDGINISKLSSENKKLLQASTRLHSAMESHSGDRMNAPPIPDTSEEEAFLFGHYIATAGYELLPEHQWSKLKTVVLNTKEEQGLNPGKIELPILSWLGKRQHRPFQSPPSVKISPNASTATYKPYKMSRANQKGKNKSRGNKTVQVAKDITRENAAEASSSSIIEYIDEHREDAVVDADQHIIVPESPLVTLDDLMTEEEGFWLQQAKKRWTSSLKNDYQAYISTSQDASAASESASSSSSSSSKTTGFKLTGKTAPKVYFDLKHKIPGVRWQDFEILCRQLKPIGLEFRGEGSSHRVLAYKGQSIGTVWRPHVLKGGPRFGAGQTKLISGYLEKLEALISNQ